MILFINGISRGIHCMQVGCPATDYESAFELLTELVAQGWILQEAYIVDGSDRMKVPVEAFDGQPIQVHIRILQQHWQQILSAPSIAASTLTKQKLNDWYIQMELYCQSLLSQLEKVISLLGIQQARLATNSGEALRLRAKKSRQRYDTCLKKLNKNLAGCFY